MKGLRKMAALLLSLGLCLGLLAGCGDDVFVAKLALTGEAGTFDPPVCRKQKFHSGGIECV